MPQFLPQDQSTGTKLGGAYTLDESGGTRVIWLAGQATHERDTSTLICVEDRGQQLVMTGGYGNFNCHGPNSTEPEPAIPLGLSPPARVIATSTLAIH